MIETLCVELTAHCGLRCSHCSASASPERTEVLDPNLLLRRLAELGDLAEIYLSGGEPCLHPAIVPLIRASRRTARAVVVYSSGVWWRGAARGSLPDGLIDELGAVSPTRIDLSLYAARAPAHDSVTSIGGSFAHTIATAHKLRAAGIGLGIHHVPVDEAPGELLATAQLAADLGVVRFHVLALAPQGRGVHLRPSHNGPEFLDEVRRLLGHPWPFELVTSSALRRAVGDWRASPRDELRAAFLDVRGHLYPGEGQRLLRLRSRKTLAERDLGELYAESAAASRAGEP